MTSFQWSVIVYTGYCYQIDPSVVEVSVSGMCNYIPGMLPAQCGVCVQEASESIIKLAQTLTIKESKQVFCILSFKSIVLTYRAWNCSCPDISGVKYIKSFKSPMKWLCWSARLQLYKGLTFCCRAMVIEKCVKIYLVTCSFITVNTWEFILTHSHMPSCSWKDELVA